MVLAILFSLDAALLGAMGWGLWRDEKSDREKLVQRAAAPVPVKIPRHTIWKTMGQKKLYEYLDRMVEPNGKNVAKHRYVHP
jgi:hypothetical protein